MLKFLSSKWKTVVICLVAAVLVTVGIIICITLVSGKDTAVDPLLADGSLAENMMQVPDVTNMSIEDAKEKLDGLGFIIQITDKQWSNTIAVDHVLTQDPESGQAANLGSMVSVVISKGPELVYITDVTYKMKDDAIAELEALGLHVEYTEIHSEVAPGAVVSQDIAENTPVPKGSTVHVVISKGFENIEIGKVLTVPNLTNKSFDEAKNLLKSMGLYIVKKSEQYSPSLPKGYIISQQQSVNSKILSGETVFVVVSSGIEKVRMPDVQFKTEAEALKMITTAKLVINVKYEESETIQKGNVIRQVEAAGTLIEINTQVTVIVSSGKNITVPNVVGKNLKDAKSSLTGIKLGFHVVEVFSNTVPANIVISQDKPAGANVPLGTAVKLTVSKGADPTASSSSESSTPPTSSKLTVPNFSGKTKEAIVQLADQNNIKIQFKYRYDGSTTSLKPGSFVSQSIAPNTEISKDTVVDITMVSVRLNQSKITTTAPAQLRLYVYDLEGNKDVVWHSSDSNVVDVSNGSIRAVGAGTASVTATYAGVASSPCVITVTMVASPVSDFYYQNYGDGIRITRYLGSDKTIIIPNIIEGKKVLSIGADAFSNTTVYQKNTTVVIPEGITDIGASAFYSCSNLSEVHLPDGLLSIGDSAFANCTSLTGITIPVSVTHIGNTAFINCPKTNFINVDNGNQNYCSKDGVLFNKSMTTIIWAPGQLSGHYVIPNGVTEIGYAAFSNCDNLTAITIPASVTRINQVFGAGNITAMYFEGNAPTLTSLTVFNHHTKLTIYYKASMTGFGSNFGGRPTQTY